MDLYTAMYQHSITAVIRRFIPSRSLVASADSASNVANSSDYTLALSSLGVLPVLVAAVDDDVALVKVG